MPSAGTEETSSPVKTRHASEPGRPGKSRVAGAPGQSRGNTPDPIETDLETRIVAAELKGRDTVADALAKRLDAYRAARAGENVVDLDARRRR
jgi:hypothetical protein